MSFSVLYCCQYVKWKYFFSLYVIPQKKKWINNLYIQNYSCINWYEYDEPNYNCAFLFTTWTFWISFFYIKILFQNRGIYDYIIMI